MDDVDITDPRIQKAIDEAIEACRAAPVLKPTGRCHNCMEHVGSLFCDDDCRDDWQHRNEREKANGS